MADIASASRGVALVNIAEALPFFHLREAVCPNGVALLILEFDDPRLPTQHQVMKVPVQSKDTKDRLIIKVAVVQVGHQQVMRNTPAQTLAVPEVPYQVVRVYWCSKINLLANGKTLSRARLKLDATRALSTAAAV